MSELETLRKRVAELEAAARRLISAWDSDTQRGITTAEDNLRALLAPREPTLNVSGLTPDRVERMKQARDAFRAEMAKHPKPSATLSQPTSFDGTFGGEVLPLDAYSSVTPEDVALLARGIGEPCGTCGGSGSGGWPCGDCGAGTGKPCGTCDGSGSVWDGPAGVHISDGNAMKPCPECRGGEESR